MAEGETEQRLHALSAWEETPFFTDRERAVLALAEAIILVSEGHVPDDARAGLMGALVDAVLTAGGHVTGVIPEAPVAKEVTHTSIPDLRVVASMHERKAMMADLADGFVALPGGWGTLEEFFELLTWAQLGLHQKPCGVLNVRGHCDGLLSFLEHSIDQRSVRREYGSMVIVSNSLDALLERFDQHVPLVVPKWIDAPAT